MVQHKYDSDVSPYGGILIIVDEMWKSLEDFVEELPKDVNYVHYKWITKNALNKIRNYFN